MLDFVSSISSYISGVAALVVLFGRAQGFIRKVSAGVNP
jgi:hypothetical protein